ncbi:MAG: TldD/PmbA family protein [Candidatus Nitrosocaldus sp.]
MRIPTNDLLIKHLNKAKMVKYLDIKVCHNKCNNLIFKGDTIAAREDEDMIITARAVANGYGIASMSNLSECYKHEPTHSSQSSPCSHNTHLQLEHNIDKIVEQAIEHATSLSCIQADCDGRGCGVNLAEVDVERGHVKDLASDHDNNNLYEVIEHVVSLLRSRLRDDVRIEVNLSYTESENGLVSSEGTDVRECIATTTIDIRLSMRYHGSIIQVSKKMGGRGGIEVLKRKSMDDALDEMITTMNHLLHARQFSVLESGRRFKVVLDNEVGGTLARLIGNMLEADEFNPKIFSSLHVQQGLEVVDDPTLPNGYGSFVWDDEGVRGRRKVLISSDTLNLLHTRLTASTPADGYSTPGNARGVYGIPKPTVSNVYIKPMDWYVDEIIDDARECIVMKGVERASADTARGIVEIKPVIAYHIKDKEIMHAIRGISLQDSIRNILKGIDAISRVAILKPYRDEQYVFRIGEGSPYIRLESARCVCSVM